jgi:hypothetical protein
MLLVKFVFYYIFCHLGRSWKNCETKCFTYVTNLSVFLKKMGGVCDRTQGLERMENLITNFLVISCNFVNLSGIRDLLGMCPIPKL